MTSSFIAERLSKMSTHPRGDTAPYSFATPMATLGGLEDRYLKLQGECHPDFTSSPIGHPQGVKMCTRIVDGKGKPVVDGKVEDKERILREQGPRGYYRGVVNLYDVTKRVPDQEWNPQFYHDRRIPWESDLLLRDYIRAPVKFSSTGIECTRTPNDEPGDNSGPFYEYGYSFSPLEDKLTGKRIATSWADTVPPVKYDVTRLIQPFPRWKVEHEHMGHPQDRLDTKLTTRWV